MRHLVFVAALLLSAFAVAGSVGGPDKHYVDASGRYLGIFRDSVDSIAATCFTASGCRPALCS